MMAKKKKYFVNDNGYFEEEPDFSNLPHRQIAYKKIYLKNRDRYPLKFREYIVHHIDGKKLNNDPSNLELLTKEEHEKLHERIKETGKYLTRKEIWNYLHSLKDPKQSTLPGEEPEPKAPVTSEEGKKKKEEEERKRKRRKLYSIGFVIIILIGVGYSLVNFDDLFENKPLSVPLDIKEPEEICNYVCKEISSIPNVYVHMVEFANYTSCACYDRSRMEARPEMYAVYKDNSVEKLR